MDINFDTVIKMDENYLIFVENEYLCIYNIEKKVVNFKIKLKNNMEVLIKIMKIDIKHPHSIRWLSKQPYWVILGVLLQKEISLFNILNNDATLKELQTNDYFSVVRRNNFAENQIINPSFEDSTLVLYGICKFTVDLYTIIKKYNYKSIIFVDREDEVEVEDINDNLNVFMWDGIGKSKSSAITEVLKSDERVKIINKKDMISLKNSDFETYIISKQNIGKQELFEINNYLVKNKKVGLFLNVTEEKLIVGPLVIGQESSCLSCMEKHGILDEYYSNTNTYYDEPFEHLALFFTLRTLFYVKGNNLFILLSDSQIPINKIITINKSDMLGEIHYLLISENCYCHNLH